MRSDDLYLSDIVQAADSIARFVEGLDEDRFIGDDLVRSAVLHKLTVIGEAAARVSSELKQSPRNSVGRHRRIPEHRRPRLFFRRLATCLERGSVRCTGVGAGHRGDHESRTRPVNRSSGRFRLPWDCRVGTQSGGDLWPVSPATSSLVSRCTSFQ